MKRASTTTETKVAQVRAELKRIRTADVNTSDGAAEVTKQTQPRWCC